MIEFTVNGPAYPLLSHGITKLHQFNVVEWLKSAAVKATGATTPEEKRRVSNWVIDLFILTKFGIVLGAWYLNIAGPVAVFGIAYLLIYNVFTYFWHHLWLPHAPEYATNNPYRERRRFITVLSAMAFSMVTYAFFYHRVFAAHFDWPRDVPAPIAALTFSVGNALTGTTGDLRAKTSCAYLLMSSQLVMTFVFVAMILNTSIPAQKRGQEE